MPFDPINYVPPPASPPPPRSPRLSPAGEKTILLLVMMLMVFLFLFPFSADTFIDIIRYARGY